MADVLATTYYKPQHMQSFGNLTVAAFRFRAAALTSGDVVLFGAIPAGSKIVDAVMANTASSASTTMSLGFRNADGTATSPDDGGATFQAPAADYWLGATAISSAARTRAGAPGTVSNGKGLALRCNKPVIITGTLGGANIATDTIIDVLISYEAEGAK